MKNIFMIIMIICLAAPAFADEKIYPSNFTPKREINGENPNMISREEYMQQRREQLQRYKSKNPGSQTSRKNFNKQTLNNKANRTFGRDNVNAARTLWSNLNN